MYLNKKIFTAFAFISLTVFSQEKIVADNESLEISNLDEVIVTATRTKRQLSSVPMPVTLITKAQIIKSGTVRLKDILVEQTGITLASDFGGAKGVQIQGISADYILILIDGLPIVGRASGNIDLNRITVNNIKQIEIVKGPSSSLYGSEAIGGVINIITEQPKNEKLEGLISYLAKGGATNQLDISTNVKWKRKGFGLVSGINLNSSNGFDLSPETLSKTTEAHQNFTGNLQVSYDFSKNLKTVVSNRVYKKYQGNNREGNKQTDWSVNAKVIQ
ncbi:TonB-dependent receptor plug domain-containing protein [Tenacibaculum pacificus]|uniref:TonB-dependent receptor plug domain-containing protein n=1 Tax=Tenacibaculum pacificus TaxID=3018314 RepID=UPI0022F3DF93|nr:TonB-dependent receptor plug domain-containing protein [Tenacibaculum pacificus]WBX74229.1 TonB-dependent receptor plug domain-containing protein [Tenacibaculum pacificus]